MPRTFAGSISLSSTIPWVFGNASNQANTLLHSHRSALGGTRLSRGFSDSYQTQVDVFILFYNKPVCCSWFSLKNLFIQIYTVYSRFPNFVYLAIHARLTVPVGPLLLVLGNNYYMCSPMKYQPLHPHFDNRGWSSL